MLGFVSVEAGKDVEWRSKEGVPSGHTTRKRIFLCLCLFFACSSLLLSSVDRSSCAFCASDLI